MDRKTQMFLTERHKSFLDRKTESFRTKRQKRHKVEDPKRGNEMTRRLNQVVLLSQAPRLFVGTLRDNMDSAR